MEQIKDYVLSFEIDGQLLEIKTFGNGHINDTFKITTTKNDYLFQRINNNVFKNVEALMDNVYRVCEHIKTKKEANPRQKMGIVLTKQGKTYIQTESGYYRMYDFVPNTCSVNIPLSNEHFKKGGICFASFAKYLLDFPAHTIYDVIENFHNTKVRFQNFDKAVKEDVKQRASKVQDLIDFVYARKDYAGVVVDLIEKGEMPVRVTHNDTKFNNLLLDKDSKDPVAVVDLDTIMKGSVCYDFGDAIRAGCNSAEEDEQDLSKVYFDFDKYVAFAQGYVGELNGLLTQTELDNLAFGCILMTFECGMRFLTDYLQGDVYFKTHYDEHNAVRTRTQFKLVQDMEKVLDKMKDVVKNA